MLSEEQLEIISEALTPLFDYLEHEVIVDIARRVGKTVELTRTAELQAIEMKRLGFSPSEIRKKAMQILNADLTFTKEVEKNTIESKREIKKTIDDIVKMARKNGKEIVASAGEMSWIDDMRIWNSNGERLNNNSYLKELVDAMQMQVGNDILNLTQSTGFKTMSGRESIESLYRAELNKALIKVTSGTFDSRTVVIDTVRNLARSGLRSIDYASGRTMQLDSAVRLAVRTGAHQLSGQIAKQNINNTGVNLVYVAEHENARNKGLGVANHEGWQGKVYYVSGKPSDYQKEAERIGQDSIKDLWEETGYSMDGAHPNNPLGLYGYNCRHIFYPWFEGASELPEKLKPRPSVEYHGKTLDGYEQTQEMRRQESNIRALKREKEALKSLNQSTREIDAKISEKAREYKEFCARCGAPQNTTKLRYECGTADITKTDAWKNYSTMYRKAKEPQNAITEVFGRRTKKEIEQRARELDAEIEKNTTQKSNWSGKINVRSMKNNKPHAEFADNSIEVGYQSSDSTILHELLHTRSALNFNQELFEMNEQLEEGTVQLFTEELGAKLGINVNKTYYLPTTRLRTINETLKIADNDFDFAKTLFDVPMDKRYIFLKEKLESSKISDGDRAKCLGIIEDLGSEMNYGDYLDEETYKLQKLGFTSRMP